MYCVMINGRSKLKFAFKVQISDLQAADASMAINARKCWCIRNILFAVKETPVKADQAQEKYTDRVWYLHQANISRWSYLLTPKHSFWQYSTICSQCCICCKHWKETGDVYDTHFIYARVMGFASTLNIGLKVVFSHKL